MSLLTELIDAASGDQVPTPVLLRRVKVLASRLKTAPLAEWVEHELTGYDTDAVLPTYRGPFSAEARGSFSGPFGHSMSNAPIPELSFSQQHRTTFAPFFTIEFRQGVAELEEVLRMAGSSETGNLHLSWPADAIAYANQLWRRGEVHWYEGMGLMDAHTPISEASVRGVLDTVRTRVLDLALAIESEDPEAGGAAESTLGPAAATHIFNTTIMGGNVALASHDFTQVLETRPESEQDLLTRLKSIGLPEDLLGELREALKADRTSGEGDGEPGTRVRAWLGKVAMRSGRAGGRIATGASGDLVAQLVMKFFGA
jgi:hypothetical protein